MVALCKRATLSNWPNHIPLTGKAAQPLSTLPVLLPQEQICSWSFQVQRHTSALRLECQTSIPTF